MKYCHFIIKISLILLFLLTGCLEPTEFQSWTPPIIKPVLKEMRQETERPLNEFDEVHVYIGDSVSIYVDNFFQANYKTIDWLINGQPTSFIGSALTVKTNKDSPFREATTYTLTVKGSHIGGSETTTIFIVVEVPPLPKPVFRDEDDDTILDDGDDDEVTVTRGDTKTFSLVNVGDYSSREWYKTDDDILGDGPFFVVTTITGSFSTLNDHYLTFRGKDDFGGVNTKTIKITVIKPPVDELELVNGNTSSNEYLEDGDEVEVIMGKTQFISIKNYLKYRDYEWSYNDNILSTEPSFAVYADINPSNPFHEVKTYSLTVKGTTALGYEETKTIKIKVVKPPVPPPQLMVDGVDWNENDLLIITKGDTKTISLKNVSAYTSMEWYITAGSPLDTNPFYVVYTMTGSFSTEGIHNLTFKGKDNFDGSNTTTIRIKVEKPTVPKPQLIVMGKSGVINDTLVDVTMGEYLTITLNNATEYFSIEWYYEDTNESSRLGSPSSSYLVSTTSGNFYNEGNNTLIVKGTNNLGDSETASTTINVIRPYLPPPELRNLATNLTLSENETVRVYQGSPQSISITNFVNYETIEWSIDGTPYTPVNNNPTLPINVGSSPFPDNNRHEYTLVAKGIKYGASKTTSITITTRPEPVLEWLDSDDADDVREWIEKYKPPNPDAIPGFQLNPASLGSLAYYKTYTGAYAGDWDDDLVWIMECINDNGWNWKIKFTGPDTQARQIYIRIEDNIATIRIYDGTTSTRYDFELSYYGIRPED
jgi:hypothetical protein